MKGGFSLKKLLSYTNEYLKKLDITDLALIKLCLIAFGVLVGISIPVKNKKWVGLIAIPVFLFTALPVLIKFFGGLPDSGKKTIKIL